MKINISRKSIYLITASFLLLLFVFIFSFAVLIPQGKEYRKSRVELLSISKDLRNYQNFFDETEEKLKDLQQKNRNIIVAFDAKFNAERFMKQNKHFFSSLSLSKAVSVEENEAFVTYEVNTTSQISSPKSFYDFLDSVNKSDWIIGVNFPIEFKREGDMIKSSFTMRIFCDNKDANTTKRAE